MTIEDFVKLKIDSNKLELDYEYVIETIYSMKKSGQPYNNEMELFYYFLLNMLGQIILTIDDGDVKRVELMGWLKVKSSIYDGKEMYFFRFETEDDYYNWLNIRKDIYKQLTDPKEIRILNFIELSTFDFVSDNITNGKYVITNGEKNIKIQKTGMVCTRKKEKFIKHIASYFNNNYIYKPI